MEQKKQTDLFKTPRRNRRGYSIVEIGLVLIIVAVLVSAIIVAFYQLQNSSRQGQVTNLVNQIYSSVQDLHRSATSYGADNTDLIQVMEAAEVVPPIGRRVAGGTVQIFTPFGEQILVRAGGAVGQTGQSFTITLTNYTRANCIAFMSNYIDRTLEQSGLVGARSGANPFVFPATVASVSTTCAAGDLALEFR